MPLIRYRYCTASCLVYGFVTIGGNLKIYGEFPSHELIYTRSFFFCRPSMNALACFDLAERNNNIRAVFDLASNA